MKEVDIFTKLVEEFLSEILKEINEIQSWNGFKQITENIVLTKDTATVEMVERKNGLMKNVWELG